jgi:glycosyltransferase involved in cell wall biosynthesis
MAVTMRTSVAAPPVTTARAPRGDLITRLDRLSAVEVSAPTDEITIVVPAFNEEQGISAQIQRIHEIMGQTHWRYEVVVVDDGSTDGTGPAAANHRVRLIRVPENRGYGAAIKRGVREARTELILIIDADGTYPTEAIPELLRHAHDFDMVVGARVGETVHIPWTRRPAKACLRLLASYLVESNILDINSGLRIIRKSIVGRFENILSTRFSFTSTLTLSMAANGFSIHYVPINYYKRVGTSKIRSVDALVFLCQTIRTIVLFNPLRIFLPLGLIALALGSGKLLYDFVQTEFSDSAVIGILAALIIWSLGFVADMITRIARGVGPDEREPTP